MKQYIVDAFTSEPFSGNPAAVCVMEAWHSKAMVFYGDGYSWRKHQP